MPEIGLLPFARVALDVATTVLPTYRSRFSKHQFTQPQLLAILCLGISSAGRNSTIRPTAVSTGSRARLKEWLQLRLECVCILKPDDLLAEYSLPIIEQCRW